jgi:hypothetical protein
LSVSTSSSCLRAADVGRIQLRRYLKRMFDNGIDWVNNYKAEQQLGIRNSLAVDLKAIIDVECL